MYIVQRVAEIPEYDNKNYGNDKNKYVQDYYVDRAVNITLCVTVCEERKIADRWTTVQ